MPIPAINAIADLSLDQALELADRRFNTDTILRRQIDDGSLAAYYQESDPGYLRFHSPEGALHIGLRTADGGRADLTGHERHAEIAAQHFEATAALDVLELGCGMGFNARWLARHDANLRVKGIDLTAAHAYSAAAAAEELPNASFVQGSYHDLPWPDESFDGLLAVETLCQSTDLPQALSEACRVLRPGGRLVNIDCFRGFPLEEASPPLARAMRLVEKSTAVNAFQTEAGWLGLAAAAGLEHVQTVDHSAETETELRRLYKLARRFFSIPFARRLLRPWFGPRLMENGVCGLLMPFTVGQGGHVYLSVIVEKPTGDHAG